MLPMYYQYGKVQAVEFLSGHTYGGLYIRPGANGVFAPINYRIILDIIASYHIVKKAPIRLILDCLVFLLRIIILFSRIVSTHT